MSDQQQLEKQLDPEAKAVLDFFSEPVTTQLRVEIFFKKFLPFLTPWKIPDHVVDECFTRLRKNGVQNPTINHLCTNLLNEWFSIPGNRPGIEVEVVDGSGNVLYTVPPLLNMSMDPVSDTENICSLVETALNHARIDHRLGDKFTKENILPLINTGSMNLENIKRWNVIYKYHGIPEIQLTPTPVNGSVNETDENDSVEFD